MQNKLPNQLDRLFSLAEDMADGCNLYETPIGLQQNKELPIRNALGAARTAQNTYQAARTGKLTATQELANADNTAKARLTIARDVLKPHLGSTWSQMWVEAGLVSGTLALPGTRGGRLALLAVLQAYFTAHPTHANEPAGATALLMGDEYDNMSSAQAGANACVADVGLKHDARDAAVTALRKRMRGLIAELRQLLPGTDARWNAFGLNPPDAVGIPDVPEGLVVMGGGAGHLFATWESAALAERYHVFKKVVDVDSEFILAATVTEPESNLNTFTPGQHVRVRVTAVNDAGESLPSDSVEQTVP